MAFKHGVYTAERETSISTPVVTASGIPFVVGRAPVHMVGGKVNTPILCNTYAEAIDALGYTDNWYEEKPNDPVDDWSKIWKYELCSMIYSHFKLFGMGPVVFVNVLDPAIHKVSVPAADVDVEDGQARLPLEALVAGLVVKSSDPEAPATYEADEDYAVFYSKGKLVVEIIDGGNIPAEVEKLNIAYTAVDPAAVVRADVIGGYDTTTKTYSGLELIDQVYPKYRILPDLIVCPGWSSNSGVAAAMAAKASNINGLFTAKALIDADCTDIRHYTDVTEWKIANNLNSKFQIVFWPMVSLDGKRYHLSAQAAGRMAATDSDNDNCPCESPSNKLLQCDSIVLADGTEVNLDVTQANYLNSVAVNTVLNFINGYVLWGNYNACYPGNTDVKDYFIPVSRMFGWVATSVTLTYWSKTDRKMIRRLIESIMDSVNIWMNALTAEEKLLGGRCEFLDEENSEIDLMAGVIKFHIFMTPPSPAQEIDFILEYDVDYVRQALAA